MFINDPWGLLLNQRGGGSIDMSRGFSGLGNLPALDWMPNPGGQYGADVRDKFPWNVADSRTFFLWYESVLYERTRAETRRLLLGGSSNISRILLAVGFGEIQLDTDVQPKKLRTIAGYTIWFEVNLFPYGPNGQNVAPPKSTSDWLDQYAVPVSPSDPAPLAPLRALPQSLLQEPSSGGDPRRANLYGLLSWTPLSNTSVSPRLPTSVPRANGLGAVTPTPLRGPQAASYSWDDAHVLPEWIPPAHDPRLVQMAVGVETGNRYLNLGVNKVLLPLFNTLAFAQNIPSAVILGVDDFLRKNLGNDYQMLQDMLPLQKTMGLAIEAGPARSYLSTLLATSRSVRTVNRSLGAVARLPALLIMTAGNGKGGGEASTLGLQLESALVPAQQAESTLGPILESVILNTEQASALPTTELPSVPVATLFNRRRFNFSAAQQRRYGLPTGTLCPACQMRPIAEGGHATPAVQMQLAADTGLISEQEAIKIARSESNWIDLCLPCNRSQGSKLIGFGAGDWPPPNPSPSFLEYIESTLGNTPPR